MVKFKFLPRPTPKRDDLRDSDFPGSGKVLSLVILGSLTFPPQALATGSVVGKPFDVIRSLKVNEGERLDLRTTNWGRVAYRYGLDPYVLYAVALVESARVRDDLARPWVWALNQDGKSLYPASATEALEEIHRHLKAGHRNIDVGLMQVNLRWHRHRVEQLADLLDPVTNLEVGAKILQEAIATSPSDRALGVGRYHAWSNRSEALKYGHHVLELADRLRRLSRRGG